MKTVGERGSDRPSVGPAAAIRAMIGPELPQTGSRAVLSAALIGAVLVALIGVPLSIALNVWLDEAFTIHTTGAGAGFAWRQAIDFESQPPLYFVLEAVWRSLNEHSIAFARFTSVVFASAAVATIVVTARRIAPRIHPLAIALVTAINPLVIWAAVELRLYALVLFLGAFLCWAFLEGFVRGQSRPARIAYTLAAIVGLYTQYYIGFVLVAHGLALLVYRRASVRAFAVSMAATAIAFAPFVPIALRHVAASGAFVSRLSLFAVAHQTFNSVFAFIIPHEIFWYGSVKLIGFATSAVLVGVILLVGRPTLDRIAGCLVAAWLSSAFIFAAVFTLSGAPIDLARHIVVIAAPSLLVAYCVLSSVQRHATALVVAGLALNVAFAGATLWGRYHPPLMKVGDWERVSRALAARDDGGVPVAVFPASLRLLLDVYEPRLRPVPIPEPMPFTLNYDRVMTLSDESSVAAVLAPLATRSDRLWVVTSGPCTSEHLDYDYHCRYLAQYLDRRYDRIQSLTFRGALAELFVVKHQSNRSKGAVLGH